MKTLEVKNLVTLSLKSWLTVGIVNCKEMAVAATQ
jgi:hypothetical protein